MDFHDDQETWQFKDQYSLYPSASGEAAQSKSPKIATFPFLSGDKGEPPPGGGDSHVAVVEKYQQAVMQVT